MHKTSQTCALYDHFWTFRRFLIHLLRTILANKFVHNWVGSLIRRISAFRQNLFSNKEFHSRKKQNSETENVKTAMWEFPGVLKYQDHIQSEEVRWYCDMMSGRRFSPIVKILNIIFHVGAMITGHYRFLRQPVLSLSSSNMLRTVLILKANAVKGFPWWVHLIRINDC